MQVKTYSKVLGVTLALSLLLPIVPAMAEFEVAQDASNKPAQKMQGKYKGQHGKTSEDWKQHHEEKMAQLGLTEQQKQQMKASHEAFKQQNQAAMDSIKAKQEQLKQLKQSGAAQDSAEVTALRQQIKQEMQALHTKKAANMRSILTPEQYAKWQTMKEERHQKWQERKNTKKSG